MNTTLLETMSKPDAKKTIKGTCLVLQYHRVGQFCYDPQKWAVSPSKFEDQMQYLSANCNVISLKQLENHITTNTPFKPRTVVVTFDGGYADVLYNGLQILDNYQVPATIFSASANIIKPGQFWWDTLEDYFIANRIEGQLVIEFDNSLYRWSMSGEMDRFKAYRDLYLVLIDKSPDQQQDILEQIALSITIQAEEFDNHTRMDAQEIKELDQSDLITIGGYTHSGAKLSSLNKFQQIDQIIKNKYVLEEITGHRIRYFSYPFGYDYSYLMNGTVRILSSNGFSLACGNSYETIRANKPVSLFNIPRVRVGNWNSIAFHFFLEGLLA